MLSFKTPLENILLIGDSASGRVNILISWKSYLNFVYYMRFITFSIKITKRYKKLA